MQPMFLIRSGADAVDARARSCRKSQVDHAVAALIWLGAMAVLCIGCDDDNRSANNGHQDLFDDDQVAEEVQNDLNGDHEDSVDGTDLLDGADLSESVDTPLDSELDVGWPPQSCGDGMTHTSGMGKSCASDADCVNQEAHICTNALFSQPDLEAMCTWTCALSTDCPAGTYCHPKNDTMVCIPEVCADSYLPSCDRDMDCALAHHSDECCSCLFGYTRAQIEYDTCLLDMDSLPLPECEVDCRDVLCDECPPTFDAVCEQHACVMRQAPPDPCDSIIIENDGPPGIYPPLYVAPEGAAGQFTQQKGAFLTHFGVTETDYEVVSHAISWTPDIDRRSTQRYIVWYDTAITEDNAVGVVESLLSQWGDFLKTSAIELELHNLRCSQDICTVAFKQNYCGLEVTSSEPAMYLGNLSVSVRNQGLSWLRDTLVPMVPIFVNPTLDHAAAEASMMGMVFEFWCADGLHTAQVTETATFTFADSLAVFVQPAENGALAYRTAYHLTVSPEGFMSWTAYVDAFDGSLLFHEADFICD